MHFLQKDFDKKAYVPAYEKTRSTSASLVKMELYFRNIFLMVGNREKHLFVLSSVGGDCRKLAISLANVSTERANSLCITEGAIIVFSED